ncbi:hypothetical protein J7392_08955 [Sulfitobacter sp. R18_1]|nr:IS3 family transposase [Sulfitobacter sp. R18_1]MBO9429608.1 hypothetical protein [Sulfitobacter sp. R18_1]
MPDLNKLDELLPWAWVPPEPRDWRAFIAAQFIDEVDAYIPSYNETRIKMSLGGRSPIEHHKSLGLMS